MPDNEVILIVKTYTFIYHFIYIPIILFTSSGLYFAPTVFFIVFLIIFLLMLLWSYFYMVFISYTKVTLTSSEIIFSNKLNHQRKIVREEIIEVKSRLKYYEFKLKNGKEIMVIPPLSNFIKLKEYLGV